MPGEPLNYRSVDKNKLTLIAYSDSDWATSKDRRSTTGYFFAMNELSAPISWKSKKQPTVALSSCKAEYMALTASTQEAMFLQMLAEDFGRSIVTPINLHGDNQGSLALVKNPISNNRSKHIDIKFHFIREKYTMGLIDLTYVPSNDKIADVMTRPVSRIKLNEFKDRLFGQQ